jgi:transposase InsO family protein
VPVVPARPFASLPERLLAAAGGQANPDRIVAIHWAWQAAEPRLSKMVNVKWSGPRHMRAMGIAGIGPGPNLRRRAHREQVSPSLLRDLTCNYPNPIWGIDVTSILLQRSWRYPVVVLDWRSRYVVSWERDATLRLPFVLRAAQRALAQATAVI